MLGLETASRLWVHNFHSFGNRILTDHRAELGLSTNAEVLDQVGQRLLLRDLRADFVDFVYHAMARDANASGRFTNVINRAKDELVTPQAFATFAQARREAFEVVHGAGQFEKVIEGLRERDALGSLWQVRGVRNDLLSGGPEAGNKRAGREARRDVGGTGEALWWNQLTKEQERLAKGLMPNYIRDAEALDVQRLIEEARAYELYQRELRMRGQLDFGEQQLLAIELLTSRPNIVRRYQDQFRHVLVDEFQDANMAQILLLELVGRGPDKPDNVVVVGDDDQSIYRFRGASYAAFEQFRERFEAPPVWDAERPMKPVVSLPLVANRRSTGDILSAASRLIGRNQKRLKKGALTPIKDAGERVSIVHAADEHDEADVVVAWIKETFDKLPHPRRWSDIAVLYRRHRHRELIVDRLRKQDIPFVIAGGTGLFDVPEVRDVEAALRVAANPDDSASFIRLLSAGPWRLDATEILRVTNAAAWDGRPVHQAAADILREGSVAASAVAANAAPAEPVEPPPTLWAAAEFDESEVQTVRERRGREQRSQQRREQLDARLRIKLERVLGLVDELVPRAPARRAVRRPRGLPGADQHAPRPDRHRDGRGAADGPRAGALHALRRRVAAVASARGAGRFRRLSGRVRDGRRRPRLGCRGPGAGRGRPADDRLPGQGPRVRGGRRAAPRGRPVPRYARRAEAAADRAAQAEAAGGLRHRRGAAAALRGHDARQEPPAADRAAARRVPHPAESFRGRDRARRCRWPRFVRRLRARHAEGRGDRVPNLGTPGGDRGGWPFGGRVGDRDDAAAAQADARPAGSREALRAAAPGDRDHGHARSARRE